MMQTHRICIIAFSLSLCCSWLNAQTPTPIPPLPQPKQVKWQQMELYAFIHFGLNTFCDREWGYGDTELSVFNPSNLDCEQWAKTCKDAGMKGIILTAKHHDGFCLWPTKYTDYSIRNTPYKDGKGDIVGELAAACRKYGLRMGVYLSPWDRHQAFYGTPLYREYFHAQLEELLTQYGEVFEVWFDGANGGDGYYGGARENRIIDRKTFYDYPRAHRTIEQLQPEAVIFSDGGPGCRWVGNEKGYAFATNWSFLRINEVYPGYDRYPELQQGHADGDTWVAAECNVSIRPGWFYHEKEDDKVKTVDQLTDLYYRSVGHNGTFLVNFPVAKDGRIHPTDSANAVNFYRRVQNELKENLLKKATIKASGFRGKEFTVKNLTDDNFDTYWATKDGITTADLTITFKKPTKVNRLKLQEYIPLGQRVSAFTIEYKTGTQWQPVRVKEELTTIGYKRLVRFETIEAKQLRVRFLESRGPLCINEAGAYYAPNGTLSYEQEKQSHASLPVKSIKLTAENEFTVELEQAQTVRSLFYLPASHGIISHYEILAGTSKENMRTVAKGEFSNIRNNPIMQEVYFTPTDAKFITLRATQTIQANEPISYEKIIIQ